MIIANEEMFVEAMKDKGISRNIIRDLKREFRGWRLYFRTKVSEYEDIKIDYQQMLKAGYTKTDALKTLSNDYELGRERIKDIVAKQGEFDFEV